MLVKKIFTRGKDGSYCNLEIDCEEQFLPYEGDLMATDNGQEVYISEVLLEEDFFEDIVFIKTRLIYNDSNELIGNTPMLLRRVGTAHSSYGVYIKDPHKDVHYISDI